MLWKLTSKEVSILNAHPCTFEACFKIAPLPAIILGTETLKLAKKEIPWHYSKYQSSGLKVTKLFWPSVLIFLSSGIFEFSI